MLLFEDQICSFYAALLRLRPGVSILGHFPASMSGIGYLKTVNRSQYSPTIILVALLVLVAD